MAAQEIDMAIGEFRNGMEGITKSTKSHIDSSQTATPWRFAQWFFASISSTYFVR